MIIRCLTRIVALICMAVTISCGQVMAQAYPSKPIRIIVPFPAGGSADIQTRAFAETFGTAIGQNVIIENRAGAAGNIGTEIAVHAPPDGYTLVIGGPNVVNNDFLYKTMPYNWKTDLTPLGMMFSNPNVLIVNNGLPAKTTPEFIALLKASPNKYLFGSSGAGGSIHLSALLFMAMTGTSMQHIPYKGDAPAKTDLLGGEIQVMFNSLSSSLENIRADKWRALATTGATRSPLLANLPTVEESGLPGYVVTSWQGLFGPANMPPEVVAKIRKAFDAAFADRETQKRFDLIGTQASPTSAAEFSAFLASQYGLWAPVFKAANLTPQ